MEGVAGEGGWCKHIGDTGTVAGTADTVGTDAFAGSTLNKTCRKYKRKVRTC